MLRCILAVPVAPVLVTVCSIPDDAYARGDRGAIGPPPEGKCPA